MRKISLSIALIILATYASAQWSTSGSNIYYNNGNVGIGISSPQQKLHINGNIKGPGHGLLKIQTNSGYLEIGPANTSFTHFLTDRPNFYFKGEKFFFDNPNTSNQWGNVTLEAYDESLAIKSGGKISIDSKGVPGVLVDGGRITINALQPGCCPTTLNVNGGVTAGGFYTSSDKTYKKNIKRISNPTKILSKVSGYRYQLKSEIIDDGKYVASKYRYGLIAQEVREIMPEAVIGQDGEYAVNYNAFIPLLVESYNAQQLIIEKLQAQLNQMINEVAALRSGSISESESSEQKLFQNQPNPFDNNTFIEYSIAESANAKLYIYDLQGKQIKSFELEIGKNRVEILAEEMPAGTYIYTLISEGKVIDSKRMILTK